jgi:hypothetical protein
MTSSKAYRADGTKKSSRTPQGPRDQRKRAKSKRVSQSAPSLPQQSTASSSIATPTASTAASSNVTSTASTPGPPWKLAAISQTCPLAVLPLELQLGIFSHLPIEDFSDFRALCQEFHSLSTKCEAEVVAAATKHHTERLETTANLIKASRMPTDADTFLAGMRTWTSLRGSFRDLALSTQSLEKWFSYLAGCKAKSKPAEVFEKWAVLGALATQIQMHKNYEVANGLPATDDSLNREFLYGFLIDEVDKRKVSKLLDPSELRNRQPGITSMIPR